MAAASDQQVQAFVNNKVRPRCNAIVQLFILMQQDKAQIDDIYTAVSEGSPTWSDNNTSGPPHLATAGDVLNYNEFISNMATAMAADSAWPIIQKLCSANVVGQ